MYTVQSIQRIYINKAVFIQYDNTGFWNDLVLFIGLIALKMLFNIPTVGRNAYFEQLNLNGVWLQGCGMPELQ